MRYNLVFWAIILLLGCNKQSSAYIAGLEYCNCLKENQKLSPPIIFFKCDSLISKKYEQLEIYFQTRDTVMSDIYGDQEIKEVYNFLNVFLKTVDSCAPPGWVKKISN